MGGQHEQHGSQHDQSRMVNKKEDGEEDVEKLASAQKEDWHDVKVADAGKDAEDEELVIENLENLQDTTALVVTREGSRFKIGISKRQDLNASDIVSQVHSSHNHSLNSGNQQPLMQGTLAKRVKLRGKFSSRVTLEERQSKNGKPTSLPNAVRNKYLSMQS